MKLEKTLEELQAEATGLGIKFHPKTGEKKLSDLIEAFYTNQSAGDLVEAQEDEETETETEETDTDEKEDTHVAPKKPKGKLTKEEVLRNIIAAEKEKAMKKRIVTITSNDKRDNDVATTTYLGFENQYFGISRLVPLDIPVELEECLIEIAKTTYITLHRDEIIEGRRTGNKIPVPTRKLNISYEDVAAR